MKNRWLVVCIVCLSMRLLDAQKPAISVSGAVLDAETNQPITGFVIQGGHVDKDGKISWGYSLTRRGGSSQYQASIRWDDGWRARIIAAGYKAQPILTKRPDGDSLKGHDLRMVRGEKVTGQLLDHLGKPVTNGHLFVVGGRSVSIHDGKAWVGFGSPDREDGSVEKSKTDANGRFTLVGIDDEFHRIAVSCPTLDLWVVSAKSRPAGKEWTIQLPPPHSLTIHYDIGGGPEPGKFFVQMATFENPEWKLVEWARSIEVKNGGKVTLTNLAQSTFIVSRRKDVGLGGMVRGSFCEQQRVQVGEKGKPGVIRYVRTTGSSVSGRVIGFPRTEQNAPKVPGAFIYIRPPTAIADPRKSDYKLPTFDVMGCDNQGVFATEQLLPGEYKAIAYAYEPLEGAARFQSGIQLPSYVGEARFTIKGTKPPQVLQIELKPLNEK